MPQYVIHIGPHKTGTTYLQHAFTRLRPELLARGILYPDQWGGLNGHHDLAKKLTEGDDGSLAAAFRKFNRSGARTILLSSETFSLCGDVEIALLHRLLAGAPAIVVFYSRRWSELIPSMWGEEIRHGSRVTLPAFAFSRLADPAIFPLTDFDQVLTKFARRFGDNTMRIASYNGVLESDDDLLPHFCREFLGWLDPPISHRARVNETFTMVDHELIRALNVLERMETGDEQMLLAVGFMAAKVDFPISWLIEEAMQYTVETLRIDDNAPGLAALHARLVERWGTASVSPLQKAEFFEPRTVDTLYVRPDYLMAKGVMETLRGMHQTLRARGNVCKPN